MNGKPDRSSRFALIQLVLMAAVVAAFVADSRTRRPVPAARRAPAPGVLTSAVQNLVGNAIKFIDEAPRKVVRVRVREAGALVRVEVQDTGPGVPEAIRAKVFEPSSCAAPTR